jgi:probable rRNA maturation factor
MVINRQRGIRVSTASLARFLARVRRELSLNGHDLAVCLMSEAEIARLNQTYRGKRGPTDVLSFPAAGDSSASSASSTSFLGDIAISPTVAQRNARRFSRTLDEELRILILHGVLHLLGYDHETDRGQMERLEHRLRACLGIERVTSRRRDGGG